MIGLPCPGGSARDVWLILVGGGRLRGAHGALTSPVAILGQSDLVEDQSGPLNQAERDEREGEVLPEPSAERDGTRDPSQHQQHGGAEPQDATAPAHDAPAGDSYGIT